MRVCQRNDSSFEPAQREQRQMRRDVSVRARGNATAERLLFQQTGLLMPRLCWL